MEIGIGLDSSLDLSLDEEAQTAAEAARLGYTSIWTPSSAANDPFQLCAHRWAATCGVVPDGLSTGISVLPVHSDIAVSPTYLRSPLELALSGGTLTQLSGGRFVLGIGTGGLYRNEVRQALGHGQISALGVMRDYLTTLRPLLAGEAVTYEGSALRLRGARLAMRPPPHTPVYLAALGPEMLRLAGELADGVALNWCSPEQTAWSRLRIAEGAARAGRDPAAVRVIDYIRVCVDDDVDVARRAFTRMVMRYALGPRGPRARERALGYRGHFERMGFAGALAELDRMRERAASVEALVDAFPTDLLDRVGYYGPAAGAAETVRRIAGGLDTAIVRVVAARPGMDAVLAVMHACQPRLVQAAAA